MGEYAWRLTSQNLAPNFTAERTIILDVVKGRRAYNHPIACSRSIGRD